MTPKTIEQRLDSIEIMLATILNNMGAQQTGPGDMKQFIAERKARGMSATEIAKQWNQTKLGANNPPQSCRF